MPKHTAPQPRYTLCLSGGFTGSIHPTYSVFIRKSIPGGIDGPFNEAMQLSGRGQITDTLGDYLDDRGFRPVDIHLPWTVLPTVNGTLEAELPIEPVR